MSIFNKLKISRKAKIIIGIFISAIALVLITIGVYSTWNNMFRQNDRFLMLRVNVTSADGHGRWHGKVKEVMPMVIESRMEQKNPLPLKEDKKETDMLPGKDKKSDSLFNLFELDLKKLRENLEEVPEIERVEVRRVLPDTLDIKIIERIPVAVLGASSGQLLVDKDGVVIRRSRCINISEGLPVIVRFNEGDVKAGDKASKEKARDKNPKTGSKSDNSSTMAAKTDSMVDEVKPKNLNPQPGDKLDDLKDALEFIRLTKKVSDYAVLRITNMDLSKDDYITMKIFYGRDERVYTIVLPAKDPAEGLDRILSAIEQSKKGDRDRRFINLKYKDQAVLKEEAE